MSISALIVEDEAVSARDLKDIMQHLGHKVCGVASSYDQAVSLADACKPEIALLDIKLKSKLSGVDVARYLREHHTLPIVFLTSRSDPQTVQEARALKINGYIIKPFTEEIVYAAVETAFGNFLDASFEETASPEQVVAKGGLAPFLARRIEAYISEHFQSQLTLDDLAQRAGLSRFHFAASFKQTFGEPPHRYVILKRINYAKKLLLETDMSVTDISADVGYENQSHFTTLFRREVGLPPATYRKQKRA